MSRSGYSDDNDGDDNDGRLQLWRANVDRTIAGKRGQAFLREMAAALDAMPVRELVADEVVRDSEHVCAIGSVALARKLDVSKVDPYEPIDVAAAFGVSSMLVQEIAYTNDECGERWEETPSDPPGGWPKRRRVQETPAERWTRMRAWVAANLRAALGEE